MTLHRPSLIAVTIAFLFCASSAFSQTSRNWDGGGADNNWATALNWTGDTVPTINDAANVYANATITIDTVQFANTSDFGRTGNSAQMDITSTGSLTLGGSGLGGAEGTIWMAWVHSSLGADSSIINVNGGSFQAILVDSGMQRVNDHTGIHVNSGGSFTVTNNLRWNLNGGLVGQTQDITIDGVGSTFTVANTMDLRGTDDLMTLTGGATLDAGNLLYDPRDDSLFTVAGTSTLIVGEGTITDGLSVDSGALVQLDGGGTGTLTTNGLTGTGTIESSGAGASTLTVGSGNASSTFSGLIRENSGTLSLTKTGSGTLTLNTANTFSGGTTINDGTIQMDHGDALGTGSITVGTTSTAKLLVADGVTVHEEVTVNGSGGGTVKLDSLGTSNFEGLVTINSLTRIGNGGRTLNFDGGLTSTSTQLFIADANFNVNPLTLGTGENWQHVSDTTFGVTGNTWTKQIVAFGGSTTIGVNDALPTASGIQFGWGNNVGWNTATLDLNGFDQEVAFIETVVSGQGLANDQNITGSGGTLTVNQSVASKNYQGRFTGNISLVKEGIGTLVLNNLSGTANNYTGNTTINVGTLEIISTTENNPIASSPLIMVGSGASLDVSGITALGGFEVVSAQTLAGNGNVIGDVTVKPDGNLAPGESIGTLTFDDDVVLIGNLLIELDGAGTGLSDLLAVTGTLDITGATVDFSVIGTSLDDNNYVFATHGGLTGEFANIVNTPNGYFVRYNFGGNNIVLTSVPEPASCLLIGMGFGGLMFRRRRK